MANLPPRPESPLRMPLREERRHLPDDRDRDRRSAQPMASRFRDERFPERDRSYVPRPRLDTYIASGFDGRRDSDRPSDRDRVRRDLDRENRERDRRNWERQQRERERSPPKRWNSPDRDRDRRPYDRDRGPPPRRPLSPPRRSGPRQSRSPPPRQRYSRSPLPHFRGRNRTRSRSRSPRHSPPPHVRMRLGHNSMGASPRSRSSRSPHRQQPSRDRSPLSPSKRDPPRRPSVLRESEQKEEKSEPANSVQDVPMDVTSNEQSTNTVQVKMEEPSSTTLAPQPPTTSIPSETEPTTASTAVPEMQPAPPATSTEHNKSEPQPGIKPEVSDYSQPKIEVVPQSVVSSALPKPSAILASRDETVDVKMDNTESPKPSATVSYNSGGSASPKPSPIINDIRGPPTGPRRAPARSPPRGPRHHQRPPPALQASAVPHQATPRGPRRDYRATASSYPSASSKSGYPLPSIPRYHKPHNLQLHDLEMELSRIQHHRANLAAEHVQQMKGARRALQELDMSTIDLQAAENRRRIADMQLEKAKSGSLGIDAPATDFEN